MSYAGQRVDVLLAKMDQHRSRIAGVVWDYEHRGTSQEVAERDLRTAYERAKALGLAFGVVTLANPKASLRENGIDYRRLAQFADFVLPMLYAQWWGMKRTKVEQFLAEQRAETRLPIVGLVALETTMTKPPRRLTSQEIRSIYTGLRVDALAVWNVKDLSEGDVQALRTLR
jgi:hypothetical protein